MGRIDLWPGQRLSQWANCECRAWCSLLRKVNLPPRGPRPTFRCLRTTFLRRVLSFSLIAMCKPVSKTIFSDPQENEKKDVSATGVYSPNLMDFEWSSMLFFFFCSLSKPSQSMRMVLAIRLFEFRSRKDKPLKVKDTCTMHAELLRCTVYACEAALAMGKPQESGGNSKNQPISELDIFSKRQALSRAVVVNSNMSRRKYLAQEGPGSRLQAKLTGKCQVVQHSSVFVQRYYKRRRTAEKKKTRKSSRGSQYMYKASEERCPDPRRLDD